MNSVQQPNTRKE